MLLTIIVQRFANFTYDLVRGTIRSTKQFYLREEDSSKKIFRVQLSKKSMILLLLLLVLLGINFQNACHFCIHFNCLMFFKVSTTKRIFFFNPF
jgi:hypothetical protein